MIDSADEFIELHLNGSRVPGTGHQNDASQQHGSDGQEQVEDEGPVIVEAEERPSTQTDRDREAGG